MLRLQRGEPMMYRSTEDAQRCGFGGHVLARVFNDVGSVVIRVKPSPSVRPGQVIVYHAWESNQFRDWAQSQEAVPSPWKPSHLADGYVHVRYRMFGAAPSHAPRATAVEVERA